MSRMRGALSKEKKEQEGIVKKREAFLADAVAVRRASKSKEATIPQEERDVFSRV